MLKNRNVSGGYYPPLRWKRNVFEIFKHQFAALIIRKESVMKKLFFALLAICLILAGCSRTEPAPTETAAPVTESTAA